MIFEQVCQTKIIAAYPQRGGSDDRLMEEVLRRRFNHYLTATEELNRPGKRIDTGFGILPDLLIVDGGKGQLNRAVAVLDEFNLSQRITLVGLAKQEEELFRPGEHDSVRLEDRSQGLFLIQRIRDEAHRCHHRSPSAAW